MEPFHKAIIEMTSEISQSWWWDHPDNPTPGRIRGLGQRINNPELFREFRASRLGEYYLALIEPYESVFEDDWLPDTILGLKLPKAKEFISLVHSEVSQNGLLAAEHKLREHYARLTRSA